METAAYSIKDYIKETGLTGNTILDSLIITSIIPLVISYVISIFHICTNISAKIGVFIIQWIKHTIKSKIVGNIVAKITIEKNNVFYRTLDSILFSKNELPSELKKLLVTKISSLSDYFTNDDNNPAKSPADIEGSHYSNSYFYYLFRSKKQYKIDLNYTEADKLLSSSKTHGSEGLDTKTFNYGNYHIKFIKSKHGIDNAKINIQMVSFDKTKSDKITSKKHIENLEKFFSDVLKIRETGYLEYIYTITLDDLHVQLDKLQGNLKYSSGLRAIGIGNGKYPFTDKKNDNTEESYMSKQSTLITDDNNFSNPDRSYQNLIDFTSNNEQYGNGISFNSLYKRYIDEKIPGFNWRSYFIHNNKIFLLYSADDGQWKLTLISPTILSKQDVKNDIDWLIKVCHRSSDLNETIKKKEITVNKRSQKKWQKYILDKRTFDTIYLPEKTLTTIIADIKNFISMATLYKEYQIPYRRGYLFYGPPGTGKSSIAKAIAYEFQMNVYVININDEEINDDSIIDILNSIAGENNKIVLFEDIDSAFADKETIKNEEKVTHSANKNKYNSAKSSEDSSDSKTDPAKDALIWRALNQIDQPVPSRKYLTYSGLLNALDGILSNQYGVITIMTTNYIEKLGPALIRNGRIDCKFELVECNGEQIIMMIKSFINKRVNQLKYLSESLKTNMYDEIIAKYTQEYVAKEAIIFAERLVDSNGMTKFTPSQFQHYLIKYIEKIEPIFTNYDELLTPLTN